MKRRLNNSGNAEDLETTLQLRGTIDIMVCAGLTAGKVLPGNCEGIERIMFVLVLFVSVVLAIRFTFLMSSFTSSSLLIKLGWHSENFCILRIDLSMMIEFVLKIDCDRLCVQVQIAPANRIITSFDRRRGLSHDRWHMQKSVF